MKLGKLAGSLRRRSDGAGANDTVQIAAHEARAAAQIIHQHGAFVAMLRAVRERCDRGIHHTDQVKGETFADQIDALIGGEDGTQPDEIERDAPEMLGLLRLIIGDLPQRRDWLDPTVESRARELIKKHGPKT